MAARRLITVMIVLLVLSSVAAALVPVERSANKDTSTTTTTTTTTAAGGVLRRATIDAGGRRRRVSIAAGDQLALTVRTPRPDQVEIAAFGELEDADPALPAHFDLLAFQPGSYPVRLVGADRTIGRIVVRRARPAS